MRESGHSQVSIMTDDEWNGERPPDPIAEPAGPGEPIDSVVLLADDDGASHQYESDGRVHLHDDEWGVVCVQASSAAVQFFETCLHESASNQETLCPALADGTVVASGVIKAVGQQVETLYITIALHENERDATDGGGPPDGETDE
jgi:hypothetical protein